MTAKHMPEHSEHSTKHPNEYVPQAMPGNAPSNAHTDIHTYKHSLTLRNHLALRNARRGGSRFVPAEMPDARPAAASRGPKAVRHGR